MAWIASKLAHPRGTPGFTMIARRVALGTTSLSNSNHFSLRLYSERRESTCVAVRPRHVIDYPAPNWINDICECDRRTVSGPLQCN
jgi:hypothetical protein